MRVWIPVVCALVASCVAACSGESAGCEEGTIEIEDDVCVSEGIAPGYSGELCRESGSLSDSPGTACEIAWRCGSHTLALACEPAGSGYLCHCNENAVSTFDFFSPNACEDVTNAYRGEIAADNCNWPVTWTW